MGRTLAVACNECKFVVHLYTALPSSLKRLEGKQFQYCPLCGSIGISLTTMKEVEDYDASYLLGLPLGLYAQLRNSWWAYCQDHWRTHNNAPLQFKAWIVNSLKAKV